MDWMEEVRENLKKRRQILFSKDAVCLQPLAAQLAQQPHTVLVLWALAWAEETVDTLEARYPQERRPREALEAARAWAAGALKMRPASAGHPGLPRPGQGAHPEGGHRPVPRGGPGLLGGPHPGPRAGLPPL